MTCPPTNASSSPYAELAAPFHRHMQRLESIDRNFQLAKFAIKQLLALDLASLPKQILPISFRVYPGLTPDRQTLAHQSPEQFRDELIAETENEFSQLSASAAVALWVSVEELVRQFGVLWAMRYAPKVVLAKPTREILISAADLLHVDDAREQIAWKLCKDIMAQATGHCALDRFDYLQKILGLDAPLTDKVVRETLKELEQVRHLIVHRSGVVDAGFKTKLRSVVSITEKDGDIFLVTPKRYAHYADAVYSYTTTVMTRVRTAVPGVVNF